MKKILFFILVFFSAISIANAETIYSEYSDFSDWNKEKVDSSDLVNVEVDRRYKYYHEEKEGDYYIEGQNISKYPLIDRNNTKEVTGDWQDERGEVLPNQKVEEKTTYKYSKPAPIRYIVISNAYGSNENLRISEIVIYGNGSKVNYSVSCPQCSINFESYVKNQVVAENLSHVANGGTITIDLNDYYDYKKVKILFYIYDVGDRIKEYKISFKRELNGEDYCTFSFYEDFQSELNRMYLVQYNYENMSPGKITYQDVIESDTKLENDYEEVEIKKYKITNLYYYYYLSNKEYNDTETDYYNIKDETQYEDYYRSQTRDKVVLKDDIIINSYEDDLNNYIIDSSVDVTVEHNIDFHKNGTYIVKYITPFKTIEKEVTVDIMENKYNESIEELNKYKEDVNKLNELVTKYKNEGNIELYNQYVEELNNYNIEIEKLNSKIIEYESKLKLKEEEKNRLKKEYENEIINLKAQEDKCEEVVEEKDNSSIYFTLGFLFLIVFIINMIIKIIKKKRKTSFVENV